MFRLLSQPYPNEDAPWPQIRKAALIGLFVGLFLIVFQPFGLSAWQTPDKWLKIAGFGLVTFVITALNFTVWQRLFSDQFSDRHWTVGREILLVLSNILLIAVVNRLYLEWLLDGVRGSSTEWLGMVLATFLISLFPVTALVLLNYIRQLKKYSQTAAALPTHPQQPMLTTDSSTDGRILGAGSDEPLEATLTLIADNEKDSLSVAPTHLLFIESSDNYCTVTYLNNSKPVRPLIRSSLSRLEGQISASYIVRCHRSYVVNLNRVERVTGNAQGYKLHLLNGQFQVPVARKYNETLVSQLKSMV